MCIIIAKPAGVALPPLEHIEESWENNPHGFGAMWCDKKGKIKTFKTMEKKKCVDFYKSIMNSGSFFKETPLSLHFRLATHGSKCLDNCHAFVDSESKVGFQHNGILHVCIPKDMDITDSEYVFRYMLLPSYAYHGKMHSHVVDNVRGASDKFSIIVDGSLMLFGNFTNDRGVFYSNSGYKNYASYFNYRVPPVYSRKKTEPVMFTDEDIAKNCATCRDFNCMTCSVMDGYYD